MVALYDVLSFGLASVLRNHRRTHEGYSPRNITTSIFELGPLSYNRLADFLLSNSIPQESQRFQSCILLPPNFLLLACSWAHGVRLLIGRFLGS